MRDDYSTLPHIALMPGSSFARPAGSQRVSLDSPALAVMTDFKHVWAVTVPSGTLMDDALERMKTQGVRMLLVVTEGDEVMGLVTAKDIQGERPILLVREGGLSRAELTVDQIMVPQSAIEVMTLSSIRNAQVGHVVATLRALERQHALVVEVEDTTRKQTIRGVFSTSDLGKRLGTDVGEAMAGSHSLAELQHTVSGAG